MNNEKEKYPYLGAQLRAKLTENEDLKILEETGIIDKRFIGVLERLQRYNSAENSQLYERIKSRQINIGVNEALKDSSKDRLAYATGKSENKAELSSLTLQKRLVDYFKVKGKVFVMSGNPDSGKTNFALVIAYLLNMMEDITVLSNMESVKEFETVKTFDKLEQRANELDRWLYILEDASNHLSGYQMDREMVEEKIRPFKNELAKNGGIMILMGHSGVDIHPDIRRNSMLIDKKNKKSAKIHRFKFDGSIKKGVVKSFNNIPKSPYSYNSNEKTEFILQSKQEKEKKRNIEAEIRHKIAKKLAKSNKVSTVDLKHNNAKVADIMRQMAEKESYLSFDNKSPKTLKKKVI